VEVERRGFVSVVVEGSGFECFCEVRRRARVARVDCEERMVDACMLRWVLREETGRISMEERGRKLFTLCFEGFYFVVELRADRILRNRIISRRYHGDVLLKVKQ